MDYYTDFTSVIKDAELESEQEMMQIDETDLESALDGDNRLDLREPKE